MKRYILFIIIILLGGCKLFTTTTEEPDNPPRITNRIPTEYTLNKKIGDTVTFEVTARDADGDSLDYMTLIDGVTVGDSSSYTFNIVEMGTFLIQIVVYNTEADTAEWQVNVENQAPIIDYTFGNAITKNEDEINIEEIVKSIIIYDNEDLIEDISLELTQSNPDLIKLALDDDNNLIVESYQANGNGSSEITLKVTDTNSGVAEKSFIYTINPMTDIAGTILDSDTWETNTDLQGFAIIQGDTVWADATGKYKTQIDPATSLDIEAGYRSLDKSQPMSFITTARSVLANNDISDADIMVVTYLNNNMTPEEFRILAYETNFSRLGLHGAKVPSVDMKDYFILRGNIAVDYKGDSYIEAFPDSELVIVKSLIRDSIDVHLKYPFQMMDTTYYDGMYQDIDVCIWQYKRFDNMSIGSGDYNADGIIDHVNITICGDWSEDWYHKWWISAILEEGFSGRGLFGPPTDPILEGKTLVYEHKGTEWVHDADIKFIKFIEGVAHEVGYLKPKMPLDDVFKIQE